MRLPRFLAFAVGALVASTANAGVFILDGTDADDHGNATGTTNNDGWFYIQRGLENITSSSDLTTANRVIAVLGSSLGSQAGNAVNSAFVNSSITGWTIQFIDGDADVSSFFSNTGAAGQNINEAGMIYVPTWSRDVTGGISDSELAILTANATAMDDLLSLGGGLFSHSNSYDWLSALVPGITVTDVGAGGISGLSLTAAGTANFPGLTNSDLSSGPWHAYFTNFGTLPVLAEGPNGQAVILGGSGGTIRQPPTGAIPEPSTWAMMLMGFGMAGTALRFSRRRSGSTKAAIA